ncbi:hypothetical protein AVEN_111989-1 [Araneus ventricosus]|uniref:Uncharacterized protein n=1 Tax=Araneus ventricosus TaxID=182803 RepID=A0A4Y2HZY5_ARAVE|nr:hypothetical protein AVEN_111989-1 [Araneus ventricosus]
MYTVQFSLAMLTSRFEATRGLFRSGTLHFQPWSDDTCAGDPSPNFGTTTEGGLLTHSARFWAHAHGGLSVESGFESGTSCPAAATLSLGHRGPVYNAGSLKMIVPISNVYNC